MSQAAENKIPTTLTRLSELTEREGGDELSQEELGEVFQWLWWAYTHLSSRNAYHRKRTIKLGLMKKMAETLLSQDEIERLEAQAEEEVDAEAGG